MIKKMTKNNLTFATLKHLRYVIKIFISELEVSPLLQILYSHFQWFGGKKKQYMYI